jgi:hypothetical protein
MLQVFEQQWHLVVEQRLDQRVYTEPAQLLAARHHRSPMYILHRSIICQYMLLAMVGLGVKEKGISCYRNLQVRDTIGARKTFQLNYPIHIHDDMVDSFHYKVEVYVIPHSYSCNNEHS